MKKHTNLFVTCGGACCYGKAVAGTMANRVVDRLNVPPVRRHVLTSIPISIKFLHGGTSALLEKCVK